MNLGLKDKEVLVTAARKKSGAVFACQLIGQSGKLIAVIACEKGDGGVQ